MDLLTLFVLFISFNILTELACLILWVTENFNLETNITFIIFLLLTTLNIYFLYKLAFCDEKQESTEGERSVLIVQCTSSKTGRRETGSVERK